MKLILNYTEVINGQLNLLPINLMMVFQVNCPGCFIHGFPLLKELQAYYYKSLSCFALSTAFEDFHLNTEVNTRVLVHSGKLVGETLKAKEAGMLHWNNSILSFPVLIDEMASKKELLHPEFIDNIAKNIFDWNLNKIESENLKINAYNYFNQLPKCGKTFAANLMRGTPSFFLFTDSMEILVQWFGYADSKEIKKELDKFIEKKHG